MDRARTLQSPGPEWGRQGLQDSRGGVGGSPALPGALALLHAPGSPDLINL